MAVEFPYCKVDPATGVSNCHDPCLLVVLHNAGHQIAVEGLVDSGCTTTLVNAELAAAVEIDVSTCPTTQITGVGASVDGYISSLDIEVKGFEKPFNSPVFFVADLPVPILLGQLNFFEHFDVHFQKRQHKFALAESGTE